MAVKDWNGHIHRVSVKHIKNKIPEVQDFAEDVNQYMPKFMDWRIAIFETFKIDFEILKLFIDCYNRLRHDDMYVRPRLDDVYQYYYIHHPLDKGRRTCGPFKKSEIPGLRPTGTPHSINQFDNISEGMSDVRDCFVKFANRYRENPAGSIEGAIKYFDGTKEMFL